MIGTVEELERASALCGRIDFSASRSELAATLLEPVTCYLNAEVSVLRVFCFCEGAPKLATIVPLGIPDSVNDAYVTRYFRLDPARRVLQQRLARPLFAHRNGEWLNHSGTSAAAQPTPLGEQAMLRRYREELLRYRTEFLLPSNLYHHLGFRFQDTPGGRSFFFDFHRGAESAPFSRLESARAHIVAILLHAKVGQCSVVGGLFGDDDSKDRGTGEEGRANAPQCVAKFDKQLSARELEVVEAVALGLSNKEIAATLAISVRTVENHMRSIFAKLGIPSRTRLTARFHELKSKEWAATEATSSAVRSQ